MIRIEHLTKRFGDLVAVNDVDLEIAPGEIFGFLGPNGAGKTTTVKMLTGLIKPTSGRITIGGFDILTQPLEAKRVMGMVPDEPYVYPKLTGIEFLRFVGNLYSVPFETQKKKIPEYLEMFELQNWGAELLESYSHGMRQKIVIAAMLLHEPKVVILDEPMVGLDPKSARLVKDIFKRLAERGTTIFMCTHVLEIAEKLCDRIGIMIGGKIIALGTLDQLRQQAERQDQNLEDTFLSLTGGTEYASLLKNL